MQNTERQVDRPDPLTIEVEEARRCLADADRFLGSDILDYGFADAYYTVDALADALRRVLAALDESATATTGRPDPIVIILEGGYVQEVGTLDGGGLSRPIVILDYEASELHAKPDLDAGIYVVPPGYGGGELAYIDRRPDLGTLRPEVVGVINHLIKTGQV